MCYTALVGKSGNALEDSCSHNIFIGFWQVYGGYPCRYICKNNYFLSIHYVHLSWCEKAADVYVQFNYEVDKTLVFKVLRDACAGNMESISNRFFTTRTRTIAHAIERIRYNCESRQHRTGTSTTLSVADTLTCKDVTHRSVLMQCHPGDCVLASFGFYLLPSGHGLRD